jgi:cytochrome c oxidase cbb3-type subunit IV
MDLNDIRSLVTLLGLAFFLGLMVWAWRPARRADFESAARLPFDGEAHGSSPGAGDE